MTTPTLMQTEIGGRLQLHIGDAVNPPSCAKGDVRRLAGYETRDKVVEAVAYGAALGRGRFGSERLCRSCFSAAERRDFVRLVAAAALD